MTLFIALNSHSRGTGPVAPVRLLLSGGHLRGLRHGHQRSARPGLPHQDQGPAGHDALRPLPFFQLVGDLSVDTGTWFRSMYQKVESWIHTDKTFDLTAEEERFSNSFMEQVYELDRLHRVRLLLRGRLRHGLDASRFPGRAVALNRLARFMLDPRDQRTEAQYFDVVGDDQACSAAWAFGLVEGRSSQALRRFRTSLACCGARWPWRPPRICSGFIKRALAK